MTSNDWAVVISVGSVVVSLIGVGISMATSRRSQTYQHQWEVTPEGVAVAMRELERRGR